MAFSEFETARYRKICEEWGRELFPPEKCVGQLLPLNEIDGQSILLGERRPHWQNAGEWMDRHFAKLTWVQTDQQWRLFWMPGSTRRWTSYEPFPVATKLEDALEVIGKDAHACFLG